MSRTTNIRKLAVMALLVAVSVVLIYAVRFPLIPALKTLNSVVRWFYYKR